MRWKLAGCLLCFALSLCTGQNKQDYNWLFGHDPDFDPGTGIQGIIMDFNISDDIVSLREGGLSITGYCSSISDRNGNLLFYSNGCAIANAEHEVMPHGDSLNRGEGFFELLWGNDCAYGYPGRQNIITLPDPGNADGYYILHMIKYKVVGQPTIIERLLYSYVDMTLDGGLGDVTTLNEVVIDTNRLMSGYLTAINHSNGKDWWVLVPKNEDNYFFTLLIDENGIQRNEPQVIGPIRHWNASSAGFSRFSPDGTKYAYFNVRDQLHLYDFDRSTGKLSNFQYIEGIPDDNSFAGVEWSPNGRFIYVSNTLEIYQIDTWEADIKANGIRLIDTWDGTQNPFANTFNSMALGPDCKIYVRPKNDTYSWHIIYRPDELGTDCRFVQNAIHFPNPAGNGTLPNFPRFRVDEPDPCDPTITSVFGLPVTYTKDLVTYPNPVSTLLTVEVPEEEGQFVLRNMDGRVVYEEEVWAKDRLELDVSTFPTGIYQASYWTKDQKYVYVNGVSVVR
jgi:hypothetical protein